MKIKDDVSLIALGMLIGACAILAVVEFFHDFVRACP